MLSRRLPVAALAQEGLGGIFLGALPPGRRLLQGHRSLLSLPILYGRAFHDFCWIPPPGGMLHKS